MSRRWLLAALILVLGGAAFFVGSRLFGGSKARPSILIISIDTCRADHLGCLSGPEKFGFVGDRSATPRLDELAAGATIASHGLTPVPLTLPAHLSLMSGLYPDETGVRENDSLGVPAADTRGYSLLAEDLQDVGYQTAAFVSGQPLDARFGLNQGFRVYDDVPAGRSRQNSYRERQAEQTTGAAEQWLKRHLAVDDAEPFFLFVHYFDPHDPYLRRKEWESWPPGRRMDYLSEIAAVDRQIGRLLETIPEDTVVLVVGDHGEGLGQHGEETHGFLLHDSTLRVPFILRVPGREPVDLDGTLPTLLDVYPTLSGLAGASPRKAERRSGRDLLSPPPEGWSTRAETLYPYYQFRFARLRAYRERHAKLIEEGEEVERYDWPEDPHEKEAKAADPALLERFHASLGARQRFAAREIANAPDSSNPYFGARTAKDLEPTDEQNRKLPRVSEHFDVITALEQARAQLRGGRGGMPDPGAALRLLRPYEATMEQNPSVLYWTARANHLVNQDGRLSSEVRREHLERADRLFARHAELFGSAYAKDSRLKIRLDLHRIDGKGEHLEWIEKAVRERLAEGSQTANSYIFRALARRREKRLKEALEDFRAAARLDPGDTRIKEDIERLRRLISGR